jgi:WD40 repeat protein
VDDPVIFEAHDSYVLNLHFTHNARKLISSGMDNVIKLWSVPDWKLEHTFEGHANSVNGIGLTPDERILASGSTDCTVKLWSFPQGEILHSLQDRKKTVAGIRVSPDGSWVAAVSYGGRAMIWTISGEPVVGIKASKKNLVAVAFSPGGTVLATAGLGDDILLLSLPSGEQIGSLSGHQIAVMSLNFIEGGRYLLSMGYEQSIIFWETETWQQVRIVRPDTAGVRGLTISPDEKKVALSMESKVQLWSLADWKLETELPLSTKVASSMSFSADGKWLAVGAADKKIRVWQL